MGSQRSRSARHSRRRPAGARGAGGARGLSGALAELRRRGDRNRRYGAPRSALIRRIAALLLALCAGLLALRPAPGSSAADEVTAVASDQPAQLIDGVPLVLPLADPALAIVLEPGARVDIYAAYADSPPMLLLPNVLLIDMHTRDGGPLTSVGSTTTYLVVQITEPYRDLIEDVLAATAIIATLSPVDS